MQNMKLINCISFKQNRKFSSVTFKTLLTDGQTRFELLALSPLPPFGVGITTALGYLRHEILFESNGKCFQTALAKLFFILEVAFSPRFTTA